MMYEFTKTQVMEHTSLYRNLHKWPQLRILHRVTASARLIFVRDDHLHLMPRVAEKSPEVPHALRMLWLNIA